MYSNPSNSSDKVVYVTNSGSKYHRGGCGYLRSIILIPLELAIIRYSPCSRCRPPTSIPRNNNFSNESMIRNQNLNRSSLPGVINNSFTSFYTNLSDVYSRQETHNQTINAYSLNNHNRRNIRPQTEVLNLINDQSVISNSESRYLEEGEEDEFKGILLDDGKCTTNTKESRTIENIFTSFIPENTENKLNKNNIDNKLTKQTKDNNKDYNRNNSIKEKKNIGIDNKECNCIKVNKETSNVCKETEKTTNEYIETEIKEIKQEPNFIYFNPNSSSPQISGISLASCFNSFKKIEKGKHTEINIFLLNIFTYLVNLKIKTFIENDISSINENLLCNSLPILNNSVKKIKEHTKEGNIANFTVNR